MSWKGSQYVLDLARVNPWLTITQLAVLYALGARHHQDDHCAWGLMQRIMEDTHASESTVSHVLAELEERGLITVWEGQFPQRKGDPDDRRRTRGLFYCFVGLDPEDGPAYKGTVRHVRRGGAGTHSNSVANGATYFSDSVANGATEGAANELQTVQLIPAPGPAGPAGVRPDPLRGESGPAEPAALPVSGPAGAPDVAAPRRAADESDEPDRLPNGAQQCPMCPEVFTGSYGDHLATSARHKIRAVPDDFSPRRPSSSATRNPAAGPTEDEIAAELESMARRAPMPPSAELLAEHERMLAQERQRLKALEPAQSAETAQVAAAAAADG